MFTLVQVLPFKYGTDPGYFKLLTESGKARESDTVTMKPGATQIPQMIQGQTWLLLLQAQILQLVSPVPPKLDPGH